MSYFKQHSQHTKNLWSNFFAYEEDFLAWLNFNTEEITSLEKDSFLGYRVVYDQKGQLIEGMTKPPQAIRHICYLRNEDDLPELNKYMRELKDRYYQAVLAGAIEEGKTKDEITKLKGKFPNRFPEYYENIQQINLSINKAHSSLNISKDTPMNKELTLQAHSFTTEEQESNTEVYLNNSIKELKALGIDSAYIERSFQKLGLLKLMIKQSDLLKATKADSIQVRERTGNQYIARLFHSNGGTSKVRWGLIILNKHCDTYNVLPQPPRPHSLAKIGREFKLPIDTKLTVWIKD